MQSEQPIWATCTGPRLQALCLHYMRHLFPDLWTSICQRQLSFLVHLWFRGLLTFLHGMWSPSRSLVRKLWGSHSRNPVSSAASRLFFPSPALSCPLFCGPAGPSSSTSTPTLPLPPLLHLAELAQSPHHPEGSPDSAKLLSVGMVSHHRSHLCLGRC